MNTKVSNSITLIDFQRSQTFSFVNHNKSCSKNYDDQKRLFVPELSATYCYALMKAKANETIFNPHDFLPSECFDKNNIVLPGHLKYFLDVCNLILSSSEFKKLWLR